MTTLEDALQGFWIARERNYSPHTIRDYTGTFRRFQQYLNLHDGPADIEDITARHINQFLNWLASACKLSNKTICNHWTALSALWTWSEINLDTPHVIRGRIPPPKFQRRQPQPYTEDQVKAMLSACDTTDPWRTRPGVRTRRATRLRDRAILLTLLDTGLRASELCALRIDDYDPPTGRIHVRHGKGDKERNVFIGYAARGALWKYIEQRKRTRKAATGAASLGRVEPLFATNSNRHLTRDNLLHLIQNIGRRAGVSDPTVHRWRHTFAITMLRNGCNPYALQELLGHSDMETVKLYLKIVEQDLRTIVAAHSPGDTWRL